MTTQVRNAAMVNLLSADLQRRYEPQKALYSIMGLMMALPGLRGFWPMSAFDASGNAFDQSANVRTMTYTGNPTYNYDSLAPYIDLDGTGDYLTRADEAGLDILGTESYVASAAQGLTLGGWFWFNATGTSEYCMSKDDVSTNRSYFLRKSAGDQIQVNVSVDGTTLTAAAGGTAMSAQTWYMLVGRFVPSTSLSGWINGVEEATNTTSIPASIFNGTAAFRIGASGAATVLMTGRASLCFLCAAALSDAMIKNLFQQSRALFGV